MLVFFSMLWRWCHIFQGLQQHVVVLLLTKDGRSLIKCNAILFQLYQNFKIFQKFTEESFVINIDLFLSGELMVEVQKSRHYWSSFGQIYLRLELLRFHTTPFSSSQTSFFSTWLHYQVIHTLERVGEFIFLENRICSSCMDIRSP